MRRKKRQRRIRNTDAQKFIEMAKLRKRQEQEIREMDASFNRDDLDAQFRHATQGI